MKSNLVTKWPEKAANRSMLRAVGYKKEDFNKFQIGIASTWSNITPCNNHINILSKAVEYGVNKLAKATIFNTITVSDGISNGNYGMKYSLLSREIISSSIEIVCNAQSFDGIISIGGCDKNIPGCIIGMCKVNIPSIFIYGGTILPGKNRTDIVSVFESLGKYFAKKISEKELLEAEKNSVIGSGSCSGMYTANSMAIVAEILGISIPNSSVQNAQSVNKIINCINSGKTLFNLLKNNLKPSNIITLESLKNAIKVISLLGGSTNCILHLLNIAKTLKIKFFLKDIKDLTNNLPTISDLKPSGKFFISDLINSGGIQRFLKFLLEIGILNGDCVTITGNTLKNNLKFIKSNYKNKLLKCLNFPIKKTNQLKILFGNLSKRGCIAKISGKDGEIFIGKSIIFNSEEESIEFIYKNKILNKTVIVIRFEGPKGGPGMREMLTPTSALIGIGAVKNIALITDGRFSGGSHGFVVGHISPEAYERGEISVVRSNDLIMIDSINNKLVFFINEFKIEMRKKFFYNYSKIAFGILNLYRKMSLDSSYGSGINYE
ncbi:dihydroxy-acid dehydratase [Candidatus Carsonella ruddii]|uniref:Dihydroxy-acid dehydratase n=1 Tax=Candidatus Carsonella ruddii (Diaphorina cf. continua) TaxID=2661587 RepID=A0A7R6VY77_CARRU|nr:dihydroxy-acid dehydratase [Candidatus Carsonella ruddii (Diaphorina cf. continua)]BCG49247.1 dihydroxy-acid dehydratase [Candidatus Carsonella ruddii (Diaphorina cf. continua)]